MLLTPPAAKPEPKKSPAWLLALLGVSLAASLLCFGMGAKEAAPYVRSDLDMHEIRDCISEAGKEEEGEEGIPERDVDWGSLRKINEDIIGWIYIPGTKVDYPVLKGDKENFYLKHNYKKEPNALGSIFLPDKAALSDAHLIFYGHNMKSGRMFGQLSRYKDESFWKEHPDVYLYTPEGNCDYRVFSSFETETGHPLYHGPYESGTPEYGKLVESLASEREYDTGISAGADSRILTLSTCIGRSYSKRYVVSCVLMP